MSASPIARQATQSQSIPSRRVLLSDPSQLPSDYSSTPGGTLYSTTPGGTRIVYERSFLLQLRNSPIARTPPKNIPSILIKGADDSKENLDIIPSPTKTVEAWGVHRPLRINIGYSDDPCIYQGLQHRSSNLRHLWYLSSIHQIILEVAEEHQDQFQMEI